MRHLLVLAALLVLASCGGNRGLSSASGDISRACMASGRDAANARLCSCMQSVANQELSAADRARMVDFLGDAEAAHAVRRSDTERDDAFWDRYLDFSRAFERTCG